MPGPVDDTWTLSNGSPWSSGIWTTIRNVRGASAAPAVLSGAGRMATGSPPENCRIIAAPAETFDNLDVTVSIRSTVATTIEIGYRVGSNVDSGGDPSAGYVLQILPMYGIYKLMTINAYDNLTQAFDDHHDDGQWWTYRIHARNARHQAKWWLAADPEPPFWNLDISDATYTAGRVFLGLWNHDDNVTPAVVDWDDFHLYEVLPPPPGIYLPNALADAVYIGDAPVIAGWRGDDPIAVP